MNSRKEELLALVAKYENDKSINQRLVKSIKNFVKRHDLDNIVNEVLELEASGGRGKRPSWVRTRSAYKRMVFFMNEDLRDVLLADKNQRALFDLHKRLFIYYKTHDISFAQLVEGASNPAGIRYWLWSLCMYGIEDVFETDVVEFPREVLINRIKRYNAKAQRKRLPNLHEHLELLDRREEKMTRYDDFFGGLTPEEYEQETREYFEFLEQMGKCNYEQSSNLLEKYGSDLFQNVSDKEAEMLYYTILNWKEKAALYDDTCDRDETNSCNGGTKQKCSCGKHCKHAKGVSVKVTKGGSDILISNISSTKEALKIVNGLKL